MKRFSKLSPQKPHWIHVVSFGDHWSASVVSRFLTLGRQKTCFFVWGKGGLWHFLSESHILKWHFWIQSFPWFPYPIGSMVLVYMLT